MKTYKNRFLLLLTTVFLVFLMTMVVSTIGVNADTSEDGEIRTNESEYVVDTRYADGQHYRPKVSTPEATEPQPLTADDDEVSSGARATQKSNNGAAGGQQASTPGSEQAGQNQADGQSSADGQDPAGGDGERFDPANQNPEGNIENPIDDQGGSGELDESENGEALDEASAEEPLVVEEQDNSYDAYGRPIAVFDNEVQEDRSYYGKTKTIKLRNRGSTSCGAIARVRRNGELVTLFEQPYMQMGGTDTYEQTFTVSENLFDLGQNSIFITFDYGGLKDSVTYELILNVIPYDESENSPVELVDDTDDDDYEPVTKPVEDKSSYKSNSTDSGSKAQSDESLASDKSSKVSDSAKSGDDSSDKADKAESDKSDKSSKNADKATKSGDDESKAKDQDVVETGNENLLYLLLVVALMSVLYCIATVLIQFRQKE